MARERPRITPSNTDAESNGNGGKARADISIYGQEANHTTWRLAHMNLTIRGIDGQVAADDDVWHPAGRLGNRRCPSGLIPTFGTLGFVRR